LKISYFELNNPETRNAFGLEEAKLLLQAVKKAVKEKSLGLVIHSIDKKVFCSGGNLAVYKSQKTRASGISRNKEIRKILNEISKQPLFLVAAVDGACIGGGCELISHCDHVVASPNSRFAFKQINLSLTTGWGGLTKMLQKISSNVALDFITSGRWVSSDEALRAGFVEELAPSDVVLHRAQKWVEQRNPYSLKSLPKLRKIISQQGRGEEALFDSIWFSKEHQKILKELK
jgi:enoyl-CoA hydratase/carnithine racemase